MKRFATFCALAALVLLGRVNLLSAASKPEEFLAGALDCNTYVKELGQLAGENATNEDVKSFGKRLADDHNRMEGELLQLVKEKKVGVATGTSKEHRDKLADLKKTGKGNGYDSKFLRFVIEEHEKAVKSLEDSSKDTSGDAGCRACAEKNLPSVRKHLEEARALQKKIDR